MADNYANAKAVLPRELLALVQQYHSGLLWVPDRGAYYRERDAFIYRLADESMSVREIAATVHLCENRVRQILRARE